MAGTPRRYILDTNILVQYVRASRLGEYVEGKYALRASPIRPLVCVVVVGEIRSLAVRWGWGDSKLGCMDRLLRELVWVDLSEPEVLDAYVHVDTSRPKGWVIPQNDRWVAAAAHATGACLLTTDKHFDYLAGTFIQREYIDPALGKPT